MADDYPPGGVYAHEGIEDDVVSVSLAGQISVSNDSMSDKASKGHRAKKSKKDKKPKKPKKPLFTRARKSREQSSERSASRDSASSRRSSRSSASQSVSLSSADTWYGADVRRQGLGAARRDATYYRSVAIGNLGPLFAVQDVSTEESSHDTFYADPPMRAGGADQLFAVLTRLCRQLLRQPVLLILLLVVPLVFVAITVILWVLRGTLTAPERVMQYSRFSDPAALASQSVDYYAAFFCYNADSGEAVIAGLPPCAADALCGKGSNGNSADVPFTSNAFCVQHTSEMNTTANPYLAVIILFAAQAFTLYSPLLLDTLITTHWAGALDRDALNLVATSALVGLTPNNRYTAALGGRYMVFCGSDTQAVSALTDYMNRTYAFFHYVHGGNYPSLADAKSSHAYKDTWMIIDVDAMSASDYNVTVYVPDTALPRFGELVDTGYAGGSVTDGADVYFMSGVLTLQHALSQYYMSEVLGDPFNSEPYLGPMPYPAYKSAPLLALPRVFLPLIFVLAFLFPVAVTTKRLVQEKEMRIREAVLIMGLSTWTLYVAEIIVQFATLFVTCVASVIILRVTFVTQSDCMIMFLIYLLFVLTLIPLCGIISAFFNKARLASLMAPVIYFIISIPIFAIPNAAKGVVIGFSFLSPSAFSAAMNIFLRHEVSGGFMSRDLQAAEDSPPLAVVLGIMAADVVIYYLLMLYLDAVLPKEWGTSKHPLFFILDPIRCCCGGKRKGVAGGADGRDAEGVFEDLDHSHDVAVMDGLRKEYKRGGKTFVAVNNLYWGMRESEIAVLLGHNGAGKTTVMNMMTGMIEPDEGDCYIYGHSVRQELSDVRQNLGFCPQHNILWPELTCRDHLEFFAQIKGLKGEALEDAVCRVLYETDMLDKLDATSKSLSGGMKRKLSIAIAFVGGSRLVFLDEPTAGLDVAARRHTWDLLKRMSQSRTILLTTHYMDEADLLGHRIGIMSQGRLKCSGSGLFLKSKIGVGYSITISADPETNPVVIDNVVLDTVKGSSILGHNGCELSYQLPKVSASTFPDLLAELDEQGEALGVRGYSLTATTLEEVFLLVSGEDVSAVSGVADDAVEQVWTAEVRRHRLPVQFRAMFRKRFWNALRDRRMQCFQIVCPVVCVLIAMLLGLIQFGRDSSLSYTYDMFKDLPHTPVLDLAQCSDFFGPSPTVPGVTVNDTHFANAEFASLYSLDTWYAHSAPRFGALQCSDWQLYNYGVNFAAPEYTKMPQSPAVLMYNTSSKHQLPLNVAVYYQKFVEHVGGANVKMTTTASLTSGKPTPDGIVLIFLGALIMIPFAFLPSNPVAWVVKERECGARHLQTVAGLNYLVYWICNFVFDLCAYLISMFLVVAIFAIFQRKEFTGPKVAGPLIIMFIVYGFTSTVAAYAVSFAFKEHSSAQTTVMGISFVLGFLLLIIVAVLQLNGDTQSTADTLKWVFRIVPPYCIGEGIFNLQTLDNKIAAGRATSAWDLDELGWIMIYMAAEFPVFCLITVLVDSPWLWRCCARRKYDRDMEPRISPDEDSDVEDERKAVYEAGDVEDSSDMVRVVDLQKRYGYGRRSKLAVKGITFSIFPGEVFGFLGTNGAGKTTAISILCQQFLPTGGEASICGYDAVSDYNDVLANIGYCPQFDATLDLLTVEEHLHLYADLRGLTKEDRETTVNALVELCDLEAYRKVLASKLSGGNRRKLSTGISLIGGPRVVFLDEPTAGMDPVARRGLWTSIQKASQFCCIVLTTHHLEEVEALADIVAIMVDGSLKCIGDKVHLKNKYGSGYEVSLRVASADCADAVEEFMADSFPGALLNERDDRRLVFQVPGEFTFSDVFAAIQESKQSLQISDYSVSQTSIEQIFLQMSEKGKHGD